MTISNSWIQALFWRWGFWIRRTRGETTLWFASYASTPELFSERNGHVRTWRTWRGRWRLMARASL